MSDTIKCLCGHCGAKYRLPVEFAGRTARCKKCGNKFDVPRPAAKTLEDSVLDWLTDEEESDQPETLQPRVVSMPKQPEAPAEGEEQPRTKPNPIRLKEMNKKPA